MSLKNFDINRVGFGWDESKSSVVFLLETYAFVCLFTFIRTALYQLSRGSPGSPLVALAHKALFLSFNFYF